MGNKTHKILNVIEIVNGILTSIDSFSITSEPEPNVTLALMGKVAKGDTIKEAKQLFITKAKENGLEDENVQEAIDNEEFDDGNGYNVLLKWSDTVKTA